jgi:hypothetical protein
VLLNNLVLHICLPAGIRTTDGAELMQPVTFDAVSMLSPFYASVDQVKLLGGVSLRRLSDLTIAGQIYMASKAVDMMNYRHPMPSDNPCYWAFSNARNLWVVAKAAQDLILSMGNLLGPSSHVLANFSVAQTKGYENEGNSGKLTDLTSQLRLYDPTIRSGGRTAPGGNVRPIMAAKGVYDWSERSPARLWDPNSPGVNTTISGERGSSTGGRKAGVGFYASPVFSSPIFGFRLGSFQVGMSIDCRNTCWL